MVEAASKKPGTSWSDVPLWVWLAFAGAIAFAVIAIGLTHGSGDDTEGDKAGATSACQEFVKDRLKSPGTAKFSDETVTEGSVWTVNGSVDSQNAFGGVVRNTYNCRTTYSGGNDWQLDALDMSGN